MNGSVILENAIEAEKAELLHVLGGPSEKVQILEELAACERLLARLRKAQDLPSQDREKSA